MTDRPTASTSVPARPTASAAETPQASAAVAAVVDIFDVVLYETSEQEFTASSGAVTATGPLSATAAPMLVARVA